MRIFHVGRYYEGKGNEDRAREHIEVAAAARYAEVGGYTLVLVQRWLDELQRLVPIP